MTPERLRQIRALFDDALERAPDERRAHVAAEAGSDLELRREVEALLEARADSTQWLERPAVDALPSEADAGGPVAGRTAGRYTLVRHIGSGGMGAVYEGARSDDHFSKRVAIKLLRRGVESEQAVRRFRHERQILASLDHPNIALLMDGGVTEDGHPYFVMEYVEGEPLLDYCDARRLTIRARIELFRQVCAAVQYAHQKLIVHRDLKPSNILVTADGTVKLLDFGIAKLLGDEDRADTLPLTRGGARVLTPEYASPEQLRDLPIGTGSDVYGLGVMLFELLTGRRPFRLDALLLQEIEAVVCTQDPPRPSSVVSDDAAHARGERSGARLRSHLSGDLDSIIGMTLRKEPERRYASAERLNEDLGRYLAGKPVRAQRDRAVYRLRKFVRRHRVEVGAAALVLLSGMAAFVGVARQARDAEAARARAQARYVEGRRLASALVFELHDAIADLPGATPVRETLVRRAIEYLDAAGRDVTEDPTLDLELALAYQRIGDVQGNPTNANLGDLTGAHSTYRKALAIAEGVLAERPDDPVARRTVALSHERLADVLAPQGELASAVEHQREAIALYTSIAALQPDDAESGHALAVARLKLGDLLGHPAFALSGDRTAALAQYRRALEGLDRLAPHTADPYRNRRYRALLLERIGRLEQEGGEPGRAVVTLRRSLALRESLLEQRPLSVDGRRDVAIAHFLLCDVHLGRGDVDAARDACTRSFEIRRTLYDEDPQNAQLVRGMALIHRRLGRVADQSHDTAEAVEHLRRSVYFYEELLAGGRGTPADKDDLEAARAELSALRAGSSTLR